MPPWCQHAHMEDAVGNRVDRRSAAAFLHEYWVPAPSVSTAARSTTARLCRQTRIYFTISAYVVKCYNVRHGRIRTLGPLCEVAKPMRFVSSCTLKGPWNPTDMVSFPSLKVTPARAFINTVFQLDSRNAAPHNRPRRRISCSAVSAHHNSSTGI